MVGRGTDLLLHVLTRDPMIKLRMKTRTFNKSSAHTHMLGLFQTMRIKAFIVDFMPILVSPSQAMAPPIDVSPEHALTIATPDIRTCGSGTHRPRNYLITQFLAQSTKAAPPSDFAIFVRHLHQRSYS